MDPSLAAVIGPFLVLIDDLRWVHSALGEYDKLPGDEALMRDQFRPLLGLSMIGSFVSATRLVYHMPMVATVSLWCGIVQDDMAVSCFHLRAKRESNKANRSEWTVPKVLYIWTRYYGIAELA